MDELELCPTCWLPIISDGSIWWFICENWHCFNWYEFSDEYY
jgi:hypothetical protein